MKNPRAPQAAEKAEKAVASESHGPTRARVARIVLEHGPRTAAALASELDLTPAAIRRHLDAMVADGVLEPREQRVYGPRGRGRPAKVFHLTDTGRDHFYQAYDDLALNALRYIRDTVGDKAVVDFAQLLVGRLERRYRQVAESHREIGAEASDEPGSPEISVLAEALTKDGYAASIEPAKLGVQLCQHHCPVAHVAEQFPQLCEAETQVFSRILGRHVQRLATIAHGDGVCTTHVPTARADHEQSPTARADHEQSPTARADQEHGPTARADGPTSHSKTDQIRVRRTAS